MIFAVVVWQKGGLPLRTFIWHGLVRTVLFWICVVGTVALLDRFTALDTQLVASRIGAVLPGLVGEQLPGSSIDALSEQRFAFSLAGLLFSVGLGLIVAFAMLHAIAVRFSLHRATRLIRRYKDRPSFAQAYEAEIYPRMTAHPLLGHAWREFDETLLKNEVETGGIIGNTVRPQSFMNYGLVRERLMGLKLIGSIPGYFIGIGLLLTFTGIVLALSKASEATTASLILNDTPGMMKAMTDLLRIASFKFATSIAGLGISILLALMFKVFTVSIERGFTRFCERVEFQLRYTAPQSIAAEMNEMSKEQTVQLKAINSDLFFGRMGEKLSPQIGSAFADAITPLSDSISEAMRAMSQRSESGVSDLLDRFSTSVQGSAGTELKQLGETLARMQATLETTQKGLHGTGEEFANRMAEATASLRATFERANTQLDTELGSAASGASSKIEEAMGRVMERLEGQLGTFMSSLSDFRTSSADSVGETRKMVADAQQAAVAGIASSSLEASKALELGLADALQRIAGEIERFATAMRSGEAAMTQQAVAIGSATEQTRQVAGAFGQTAQDIRSASGPLLQSSERFAGAASQMGQSVEKAASSFERGNSAATELAQSLTDRISGLTGIWEGYKSQFDRVDESLARAVQQLSEATGAQAETLGRYAKDMNTDLAAVMDSLRPLLDGLEQNTDAIADSVEQLAKRFPMLAAE
ncbi:anti-phage ZorAB system protein ZorA [Mesorhizobium sp. M0142]|uniref:anti-phage ZorAB system protein ZorA n=1 Tax=Mesorhizobium sp. M0142 TaxID=2956894 RepID=UPI00333D9CCE